MRWLAATVALLSLSACIFFREARDPMPVVSYGIQLGPERARGAIVLLPGFADNPDDYEVHGFLKVLRANAPGYDVYAPDAHFGYYNKNTLLEQLHANAIGPLVARGYREIWISGISMGGHGAVAYARAFPDKVKGLMLFAPYMGPGDVVQEVTQAGGICRYDPAQPLPSNRYGFAQANFLWLKDALCASPQKIAVWVGVGDRDQTSRELLRDVAAPGHYIVLPGGHDWDVWTPALDRITHTVFGERGTAATQ